MKEWMFKVLGAAMQEQSKILLTVLWAVWRERNDRVWNRRSTVEEMIVKFRVDQVEEWRLAQGSRRVIDANRRPDTCMKWHKPNPGVTKINTGATISNELRCHGFGMIARNSDGDLIELKQQKWRDMLTPQEAEASCLVEALRWAAERGWNQVVFETDCQAVQQAVGRQEQDTTELGDYITDCRMLLENQPLSKVLYVRREGNRIADALAKQSLYSTEPVVGEVTPDWLVMMLLDICTIDNH